VVVSIAVVVEPSIWQAVGKSTLLMLCLDTRAAKLVIELAQKHVPLHLSLQELMEGKPLFTFTEREAARIRKIKILDGMVLPKKDDDKDHGDGQPVL
jgi:hypothetical protein